MSKELVVFFSATGVTKNVAKQIAEKKCADIHEIRPKVLYTKEDLNWENLESRSSIEMKNKSSRPEIVDDSLDMSQYDVIYLGFPIWWYVAPTIINTFLEKHDFSNKKIILFATSVSSEWGETLAGIRPSVDDCSEVVLSKVLRSKYNENVEDLISAL